MSKRGRAGGKLFSLADNITNDSSYVHMVMACYNDVIFHTMQLKTINKNRPNYCPSSRNGWMDGWINAVKQTIFYSLFNIILFRGDTTFPKSSRHIHNIYKE